jgi:hypothetical protein
MPRVRRWLPLAAKERSGVNQLGVVNQWTLAISAARNPPEWAESWVIHATQPLRGKLRELEKPHFRGFLVPKNG